MSFELSNRALATQGITEARSNSGAPGKSENQVHQARVLAVEGSAVKIGVLDESGRVVRIYTDVIPPAGETYEVGARLSVKTYQQSEGAVILSGGGGSACQNSLTIWASYYT